MKKRSIKLVKTYPGSPELNTVFHLQNGTHYFESVYYKIPIKLVEGNPEFFEEIIEKDYEILSFICNKDLRSNFISKGAIIKKTESGKFEYGIIRDFEEKILTLSHWDIHSIRRLSDNEVFTIGDKTSKGTIKSIHICDKSGEIVIYTEISNFMSGHKSFYKVKSALFIADDNVEIFKDDSVWGISSDLSYIFEEKDLEKAQRERWLKFSSKENAENHILFNKPVLSLRDIYSGGKHTTSQGMVIDHSALEELVKSRIKF